MSQVELRRLEHHAKRSRETTCFSAEVWIDGRQAGRVANDGGGGAHSYVPASLERTIEEIAKAQPAIRTHLTADRLIDRLMDAALSAADLRQLLAHHLVLVRGDEIVQTGRLPPAELAALITPDRQAQTRTRFMADEILNVLPFNAALTRYRTMARRG